MSDDFDYEAEMVEAEQDQARADRARSRVAQGLPAPVTRQTREDLARTAWLQKNNPAAVHDWLLDLENQCIALLPPEDQERFR